ncbi:MAG: type I-E CRISPR-associated protein Cse1/CasA, partial [Chloroflexi bacterium]|nr:type I-E CRISPR-associated protein Cse1/CasA [Chloroflexota bacterium]
NLFEDLALNLVRYPTRDDWCPHTEGVDRPCWEMDNPFFPERSLPLGYLDYLTWQSRRILLLPKDTDAGPMIYAAKIAPGLRMSDEMRNPAMQHKGLAKKGWKSWMAFEEDRALWRDSAPLFRLPQESLETQDSCPPIIMEWLAMLVDHVPELERHQIRRLAGLGMAGDLNQYRVHFYRREELPLPLSLLRNRDLVTHLETALAEAEGAGKQLWGAASTLATELLFHKHEEQLSKPERDERDALLRSWAAERRYWAALEVPFTELLEALPGDAQAARRAWASTVQTAAWGALEAVIAGLGEGPSALKAAVLARGQLGGGLRKVLGQWYPSSAPHEEVAHA